MIYKGDYLKEISFPLGGIGSGSIGLSGNGVLKDFEIYNKANKGSEHGYTFFAIKATYPDGKSTVKIIQGDCLENLSGTYRQGVYFGYGFGPAGSSMVAFPHFAKVTFDGSFPIAKLTFEDNDFPAKVIMEAFNPFIPLDSYNSSIPAAFFKFKVKSKVEGVKYTIYSTLENRFEKSINKLTKKGKYTAITLYDALSPKTSPKYGDLTIATDGQDCEYQQYWYRGGWQDKISVFWYELTNGRLENRVYDCEGKSDVATIGVTVGENGEARFVLSWNVPNCIYWRPHKDENGNEVTYKNYYATVFKNSLASALYSLRKFGSLYRKTARFTKSIHSSKLDKTVIDALSSTMSVLKTATVFRLEDGTLYGWEGLQEKDGSCFGTCTHVWSYAYALCFLFPDLELSLRNTELTYNTDEDGYMHFRTMLPLNGEKWDFPPCVDGQMATLIKIYRDWKLTGNTDWIKENWESIKSVLEFAWADTNKHEWDKDKDGVLEGRQHHTLDMELFGPSAWLEGMYLAALKAASEIAEYIGDSEKATEYKNLFENGYKWTKENLFNGEYFIQRVDVCDKTPTDHFNCPEYWNDEKKQLKYQIQNGSIIDQLLGQWHANISGLGDIFDKEQRKIALKNMFKNNFKSKMRDYANMWRVFALNDEGGAVMCDYPDGYEKPIIPIPYCEECMTGFEYAFAGLLISEGFIDEGLTVIKAIRDRYDGKKRNPWNEIECGSNYARPMASFALLPIFSGFEFDAPNGKIGFAPLHDGDFRCFYAFNGAWGNYIRKNNTHTLEVCGGKLSLKSIHLAGITAVKSVIVDGKEVAFTQSGDEITFDSINIANKLCIEA